MMTPEKSCGRWMMLTTSSDSIKRMLMTEASRVATCVPSGLGRQCCDAVYLMSAMSRRHPRGLVNKHLKLLENCISKHTEAVFHRYFRRGNSAPGRYFEAGYVSQYNHSREPNLRDDAEDFIVDVDIHVWVARRCGVIFTGPLPLPRGRYRLIIVATRSADLLPGPQRL
jgi:hypothetical protein